MNHEKLIKFTNKLGIYSREILPVESFFIFIFFAMLLFGIWKFTLQTLGNEQNTRETNGERTAPANDLLAW